MSGDLLGSPKPKEMAVGGLAGRWPWRGGGAREAEAQALVPHHWRGGGGGAWCRRRGGAGRAGAQAAVFEGEGGHSGGVAGFYWALPRHQRWRITAAPRWVARQTLPRRCHVILPPHHHAARHRHFAAP